MATFSLPPGMRAEIIAHARAGCPEEVCGIIAGTAEEGAMLYRGRNTSAAPAVAYELDDETLAKQIEFEDAGLAMAAIYHSHPRGPQTPSSTDVERAFYPDSVYLICSVADPDRPTVRGFRIADGQVSEVTLVG